MTEHTSEASDEFRTPRPCLFSPAPRTARALARFYAAMFPRGARIVELGFGQGYFLEAAQAAGLDVLGLDRDPKLVNEAVRRGDAVLRADVAALPSLPGAPFDGVVAAHLIEHLSPPAVAELLDKVAVATVPGGLFVIATPNYKDLRVAREWFWLDPTHVRPYPSGAVRALLDERSWEWDGDGYEPTVVTRETPVVWLNRLRFGRDYGRSGVWMRLRRRPR